MKPQLIASPVITSPDLEESSSEMGMSDSGKVMAAYFMRDKIYTDKILAVVREYSSNGIDEHQKYGITHPVTVKITTDNQFIVRDYAKGLSEYDIRNIFGMYFESTKTKTNNQIGGFGIGSKAGHCYTDTFFVKSYFQGVCSLYACTLGGGDKGIPIGQIMKVSEESTLESGIEISLEIKNSSDVARFVETSSNFVKYSYPANIVLTVEGRNGDAGSTVVPIVPSKTEDLNGYNFRLINDGSNPQQIIFTMGGVVYKKETFLKDQIRLRDDHSIVIEIPIGTMSLPISREGFETTPQNNAVINTIRQELQNLQDADFAQFQSLTIDDLLKSLDTHRVEGEWFNANKRIVFKEVYGVISQLAGTDVTKTLPLEKTADGRYLVALLPDKRTYDNWRHKFIDHSRSKGKNFFTLRESYLTLPGIDKAKLDLYFLFKPFKSVAFDWPRYAKGDPKNPMERQFSVRTTAGSDYHYRNSNNKSMLNAFELHNYVVTHFFQLPEVSTEEEAIEQISKIDFTDKKTVRLFSISEGMGSSNHYHSSTSKMVENMMSLGWMEYDDDKHKALMAEIERVKEEQDALNELLRSAYIKFMNIDFKGKWSARMRKNPRYAKRVAALLEKIRSEKKINNGVNEYSFRAKTFRAFERSYNEQTLNRVELRQILRMK